MRKLPRDKYLELYTRGTRTATSKRTPVNENSRLFRENIGFWIAGVLWGCRGLE